MNNSIKITECPRDAMQGFASIIDTSVKIEYIMKLLEVGFDVLDFGSFVSAKAIPQMWDTKEVCEALKDYHGACKLLSIVANPRGAAEASAFDIISILGYPFSVSETFQIRNTNAGIDESRLRIQEIIEIASLSSKDVIIYLSMAFGNPYGDVWNADVVNSAVDKIAQMGIKKIALSDTIGVATPESIQYIFDNVTCCFPNLEIGAHFHTTADKWEEKLQAAYQAGCRSFDGAIKGYGGCPMAKDDLVGNMPTEHILSFCDSNNLLTNINRDKFQAAFRYSDHVFNKHS